MIAAVQTLANILRFSGAIMGVLPFFCSIVYALCSFIALKAAGIVLPHLPELLIRFAAHMMLSGFVCMGIATLLDRHLRSRRLRG